jgi:hypothetical protein
MPTQLKIIADSLTPNCPFTVNFATPLIITPGNKITMDKFIAVIPDVTANFGLPSSTFTLYIAVDALNNKSIQVTIPGSTNTSVANLLNLMTESSNDGFSAYVSNMLPRVNNVNNIYRDAGLKVQYSAVSSNFSFEYVTCPFTTQQLSGVNMSITEEGNYIPSTAGLVWTLTQTETANYLTRGGGCLITFLSVLLPTEQEASDSDGYFQAGLIDTNTLFRGIGQRIDGTYYLINNMEVETTIPDTWNSERAFNMGMDIYQKNGFFQIRIYKRSTQESWFDSAIDYPEALGPIDYTVGYNFLATGQQLEILAGAISPSFSTVMNMTVDVPFQTPNITAYSRTMALNFDSAATLRSGLDLPGGEILCTPQQSSFGIYTGLTAINMALINSLFDIALEVIDLPLQTFQANSDGKPGSRKNVLAYFRPELSQVGSNTYRFDVNIFDWLDIASTYPINLSSLSFRVFNPSTNTDLVMSSCSFNLLINTKEY